MTRFIGASAKTQRWLTGILIASGVMMFVPASHAQVPRISMAARRAPGVVQRSQGTVAGSIFWEQERVAYKPSVPCQALQVELDVIAGTGMQKFATSNQFAFTQSSRPGPGLGLCSYSFHQVPEGVALQVQVSVGTPFASHLAAKGPFGTTGGVIKIPGGQCSTSPTSATPSSTSLQSGWVGCGEQAYNVNFELVPANTMAVAPRPNTTLLQRAPSAGSRPMLLRTNPQPGGPVQTNGMLVPAVRRAMGTQPPPNGGLAGGTRAGGAVTPNAQPSALIGLLRQQGSLKIVSGQRTHYATPPSTMRIGQLHQRPGGGQVPAGQPMAAPVSGTGSRISKSPLIARNLKIAYVPSNLLSEQENEACKQQESAGAPPEILRIDGKKAGPVYSPDPKTNPHTIVGCGFGNGGTVDLLLLQEEAQNSGWGSTTYANVALYTIKFNVKSWSDHEIVASVDPNTSGVPDWSGDLALEVRTKQVGDAFGGQFMALKQTLLLTSIPQKESALYPSGSPYFLSPASNYYGLDGTVAVMRQGLSGPLAGQDQFNLQLANGFVVDSTQTDLLVSDTNSNVTAKPASVNGNTITITYPVVSFQSGNSTVYYSIYGLKVWVSGPVGMNPVTP